MLMDQLIKEDLQKGSFPCSGELLCISGMPVRVTLFSTVQDKDPSIKIRMCI